MIHLNLYFVKQCSHVAEIGSLEVPSSTNNYTAFSGVIICILISHLVLVFQNVYTQSVARVLQEITNNQLIFLK